jgi:type I restriction enzyme, R subunit
MCARSSRPWKAEQDDQEAHRRREQTGSAAPQSDQGDFAVHVLNNFRQKTHRLQAGASQAKASTPCLRSAAWMRPSCTTRLSKTLQKGQRQSRLRVATIFSFAANEEQEAIGDIQDESLRSVGHEQQRQRISERGHRRLQRILQNQLQRVDSNGFQNYYRDLAKQVKAAGS